MPHRTVNDLTLLAYYVALWAALHVQDYNTVANNVSFQKLKPFLPKSSNFVIEI